jgi:LysR family transcriptional regulator of gallate degradation
LRDPGSLSDLTQEAVFTDRPAVIMRQGHALAECEQPDGAELARYPWIMPSREAPLRRYWEAMMRTAGVEPPRVDIECGSVLTVRQLLVGSDALTLLSPAQLAVELADGLLVARRPPVVVARTIGLLRRTDWRPTAAQQAFLALLRDVGREHSFA